jgi:hypothetical protein
MRGCAPERGRAAGRMTSRIAGGVVRTVRAAAVVAVVAVRAVGAVGAVRAAAVRGVRTAARGLFARRVLLLSCSL